MCLPDKDKWTHSHHVSFDGVSWRLDIPLFFQPSWYVQSFLFSLCQEINRVGGHALPKVTLQEMLKSCMVQIVAAYEKLPEEKQMKVGV